MNKNFHTIFVLFLIISCGNSKAEQTTDRVEKNVSTIEKSDAEPSVNNTVKEEQTIIEELDENKVSEAVPTEEKFAVKTPLKNEIILVEGSKVEEGIMEEKKVELTVQVKPNHEVWNALTEQFVSVSGKVNYKGMKRSFVKITAYLKHMETTPPQSDWSKNEKLAYWINLYNASTVYLITSNYPITSITKINGGKPWDKKFVKSGMNVYTLNYLENEIVRPRFKEPRIHAALNCAAVSCPKLLNEAYIPNRLSDQLDKQTKAWINDIGKNKISKDKIQVSKIFEWYADDFKAAGGTIDFINQYVEIKVKPDATVSFSEYDWALNE